MWQVIRTNNLAAELLLDHAVGALHAPLGQAHGRRVRRRRVAGRPGTGPPGALAGL